MSTSTPSRSAVPQGSRSAGKDTAIARDRLRLDLSMPVALGLGLVIVMTAMALGGPVSAFLDLRSVLIVLGGTFFVTMACFSGADILKAARGLRYVFMAPSDPIQTTSASMVRLAEKVRKEGPQGLESALPLFKDRPFLHRAMALVVDGFTPPDIERILGDEMRAVADRHRRTTHVFRRAAEVAPAMGLIGTMIGLIQMLRLLDNPAAIGPAMALALLTTLYGAVLGHMVFTPLATRLEQRSRIIHQIHTVYALAATAIARDDGPRMLETAINAHLAPPDQVRRFTF